MPSFNTTQMPATSSGSQSIRSFLHLQKDRGSVPSTMRRSASVNRLTDDFLRSVSGIGSSACIDSNADINGNFDEDVVAKMLSDGARSHTAPFTQKSHSSASSHSMSQANKGQSLLGSASPRSSRDFERRSKTSAAQSSVSFKLNPVSHLTESRWQQQQHEAPISVKAQQNLLAQSEHAPHSDGPRICVTSASSLESQEKSHPICNSAKSSNEDGMVNLPSSEASAISAGLAEIREKKASSLERSLERESVSRDAAAHNSKIIAPQTFLLAYRSSEIILQTLKPNLLSYLYVTFYSASWFCFSNCFLPVARRSNVHRQQGDIDFYICPR
jgi:hypothetical protein